VFGTCVYLSVHFVRSTFVFFAARQIMLHTFSIIVRASVARRHLLDECISRPNRHRRQNLVCAWWCSFSCARPPALAARVFCYLTGAFTSTFFSFVEFVSLLIFDSFFVLYCCKRSASLKLPSLLDFGFLFDPLIFAIAVCSLNLDLCTFNRLRQRRRGCTSWGNRVFPFSPL
jgi:hypothetical protein